MSLGSVQQLIEQKLMASFSPSFMDIQNESHTHNVPPNSETHFKVTLVSDQFTGLRSVARHQQVYKVLQDELAGPVHALALHIYTEQDWQQRNQEAPSSPKCLGGSAKSS